jgi:hypothetical protein
MDKHQKDLLASRLFVTTSKLYSLIGKIKEIEEDSQTPTIEKISQIKKIREEMSKVGTEIDSIKKEITLLNKYKLN